MSDDKEKVSDAEIAEKLRIADQTNNEGVVPSLVVLSVMAAFFTAGVLWLTTCRDKEE